VTAPAVLDHRPRQTRIFAKDPHGWYVEPGDCAAGLAEVVDLRGRTWDPACGMGQVVQALRARGLISYGTDIVRRVGDDAPWFLGECDFLADTMAMRPENIVFNPPARQAEAFIRIALRAAREKVCAFVNVRFLFSRRRATGLWFDVPPTKIWFVTPRPACPPGDYILAGNKPEGGLADWVWLTWTKGEDPQPPGWIVRPGK
jgi:hypothetical protein